MPSRHLLFHFYVYFNTSANLSLEYLKAYLYLFQRNYKFISLQNFSNGFGIFFETILLQPF